MTHELAKLHQQRQHARAQITKWQLEAAGRETHADRVQAGARVLLWQSQLRVLTRKYDTFKYVSHT